MKNPELREAFILRLLVRIDQEGVERVSAPQLAGAIDRWLNEEGVDTTGLWGRTEIIEISLMSLERKGLVQSTPSPSGDPVWRLTATGREKGSSWLLISRLQVAKLRTKTAVGLWRMYFRLRPSRSSR